MARGPGSGDDPTDGAADRQARVVGEARWPMAGAVLAATVLTYLLPADPRAGRQPAPTGHRATPILRPPAN
jgi:hypothetical protein